MKDSMIPSPARGGATVTRAAYVYLLKSGDDDTCYVGWTTDPSRRLVEPNRLFRQRGPNRAAVGRPWQVMG